MPVIAPIIATHGEKLKALLGNPKLPAADIPKVTEAVGRYETWQAALNGADGEGDDLLRKLLDATNEYKRFVEFDLIFNSDQDFLYRQKGQLKLDNTILEEFLPRLVDQRLVPGLRHIQGLTCGPQQCFAGLFIGPIRAPLGEGGVFVKTKNQDFTIGRKLYFKTSTSVDYSPNTTLDSSFNIAYFAAEIKTNLDKTMFQEAAATARELKQSVREAIYVLLCEWLDMPPIDPRLTDINDVILLRKAKRLGSGIRAEFANAEGRRNYREAYQKLITEHPVDFGAVKRLVLKMQEAFPDTFELSEETVLARGYF